MTWNDSFLRLFDHCISLYQSGNRDYMRYYNSSDLAFLESIGYQPREFFDFIEDFGDGGTPSPSTALLIAAVRRDYFLVVQAGIRSQNVLTPNDLPSFGAMFDGMAYLPRITTKARAKLRGELDPDIMYGCGGDRNFLNKHGQIHLADFLRHVWQAGDDDMAVVAYVRSQMTK